MKRFHLVLLFVLIAAISLSAAQKSQPQSQPRIDEIALEGWQGLGPDGDPIGADFKITLRRDGTALFTGKAKVKLIGDFQGTISSAEFEKAIEFPGCTKI